MRVVAALFLLVLLLHRSSCDGDDNALSRFWTEGPSAWTKIEHAYIGKRCQFKESSTESMVKPFSAELVDDQRISDANYLGNWLRVDTTTERKAIDKTAILQSQDEVAAKRIIRSKKRVETKNESSFISNEEYAAFVSLRDSPAVDTVFPPHSLELREYFHRHVRRCLPGLGLGRDQLITSSIEGVEGFDPDRFPGGYRVISADFVNGESNGLVALKLAVSELSQDEAVKSASTSIQVVLDPQRSWSVVSFSESFHLEEMDLDFGTQMKVEYPLDDPSSFHPTAINLTGYNRSSASDIEMETHVTVGKLQDSQYDRSDCYLSAFGLPEPDFSGHSLVYGILAVTALVFAIALIIFRRRLIH